MVGGYSLRQEPGEVQQLLAQSLQDWGVESAQGSRDDRRIAEVGEQLVHGRGAHRVAVQLEQHVVVVGSQPVMVPPADGFLEDVGLDLQVGPHGEKQLMVRVDRNR